MNKKKNDILNCNFKIVRFIFHIAGWLQIDEISDGSKWYYSRKRLSETDYVINPFLDFDGRPVVNGPKSVGKLNSEKCLC